MNHKASPGPLDVKTHRTIIPALLASLLFGCAPNATFTQSSQGDEYQKHPKRAFVGGNVREYAFARYLDNWLTKVERVGNLNYPEAARSEGIYGSLQLTVSIYADGSIETVTIDRSSGSKILDAAAVKIVQLAAPYAPFTEEMRKRADILSITRTWTFTRSGQLDGSSK